MQASTSDSSNIQTLDSFYLELAETVDVAGVWLPWYKTSFVHTHELRRFRSEVTIPGICLLSSDAKHFFIPEAKFTAIAQTRNNAENAAASEACRFLRTFTQRPHLIASEWSIDNSNPLYQELAQAQGLEPQPEAAPTHAPQPSEGQPFGVRDESVIPEEVENPAESSGRIPVSFTEELSRLRRQIEVLSSIVDREPVPMTSSQTEVTQTASTSYANQQAAEFRSEIEPA